MSVIKKMEFDKYGYEIVSMKGIRYKAILIEGTKIYSLIECDNLINLGRVETIKDMIDLIEKFENSINKE